MNIDTRPKLHPPLALLAAKPAFGPPPIPTRQIPHSLRRMVAAMVD